MKRISIIIPSYNEGKNITPLYGELSAVISKYPAYAWEIFFIDDGSKDETWQEIQALAGRKEQVKGLRFARNFGHQAAIEAGLKNAGGDAVIMMDGDLQHPPAFIPELIKKWEEGYLIVNTTRMDTEQGMKRFFSQLFYRIINSISETHIEPGSADFRLLDRRVVDELNSFPEKNRFYRGLVNWIGFDPISLPYTPHKRLHGKTSYTFRRMLAFARIGITSVSDAPMRFIVSVGMFIFAFGGLFTLFMILHRLILNSDYFGGAAILAGFIITNNGFLIMIFGVMSIYQVAMHKEVQARPNYIIRESTN